MPVVTGDFYSPIHSLPLYAYMVVLAAAVIYTLHLGNTKCMAGDVFKYWNYLTPVLLSLQLSTKAMALSSSVKAKEDIECYDCLTYNEDHYCSDPFNKTSKVLTTVMCEGYCAKWVREIKPGLTRVKRTCSSHLNIDMTIHLVCMEESRPGTGHICFCNKPRCNGTGPSRSTLQTVILSCLILTLLLPHFTRMVQ